jgi:hypothetical protein
MVNLQIIEHHPRQLLKVCTKASGPRLLSIKPVNTCPVITVEDTGDKRGAATVHQNEFHRIATSDSFTNYIA